MTTKLSVNLNKVATLRNTRSIGIPSVTRAATIALAAGAHGITIHPRPDERHIRPHDVDDLAALLAAYSHAELNIEGNPFEGLVEHCERVRPTQATLVPDASSQATSDHGWDLAADAGRLRPVVARLRAIGCRVSLFMDAVPATMAAARDVGADRVELYTGQAEAAVASTGGGGGAERAAATAPFSGSAGGAVRAGLGVNAGHDLNLDNLGPFLAGVPGVLEVSIGHALIADALEFGLGETVRRYVGIVGGLTGSFGFGGHRCPCSDVAAPARTSLPLLGRRCPCSDVAAPARTSLPLLGRRCPCSDVAAPARTSLALRGQPPVALSGVADPPRRVARANRSPTAIVPNSPLPIAASRPNSAASAPSARATRASPSAGIALTSTTYAAAYTRSGPAQASPS